MSLPSTSDPQAGGPRPFLGGGTGLRGQAGHARSFPAFAYIALARIPLAKAGSMGGPDVKGGQGHAAFLEAMAGAWLGRSAQGSEAPGWELSLPR